MGSAGLLRALRTRRFGWLLALALWLPAAQWLAATHAFTHLAAAGAASVSNATGAARRELPAALPDACELCVLAAAIGAGGAPAPLPAPVPGPLAAHVQPLAQPLPAPARPPLLSYRSRAPPSLPV